MCPVVRGCEPGTSRAACAAAEESGDHLLTKTSTEYAPSPIAGVRYPVRKFWPALFLLPVFAFAAPFTAVRDGESFTYKVGFAIFSNAGIIEISGKNDHTAGDLIRVTVDTKSRGFVRGMY